MDGWSNVHNDPIVCTSVTTENGNVILLDTVDTSGHSHDAEYLETLAKASIGKFEREYKGIVGSVVTDNTGNVKKMRKNLSGEDQNLLTYGCSSHLLNLLAKDVEIQGVKSQVVEIAKYFRNNHFAAAKYKLTGKPKLILPSEVGWNSFADCLEICLKSWSVLMGICDENRDQIDKNIHARLMNMGLKRNAEDMLKLIKPIAVALDRLQRNASSIADAVQAWKILEFELKEAEASKDVLKAFKFRKNLALSSAHYLANILHPVYNGKKLTPEEVDSAMTFAAEKSDSCAAFLPTVIKYRAQNGRPFLKVLFDPIAQKDVTAVEWWKSMEGQLEPGVLKIVLQLLTASASTAGLERLFSSFGIVHSDMRNRLGTVKASKLVFLLRKFHGDSD